MYIQKFYVHRQTAVQYAEYVGRKIIKNTNSNKSTFVFVSSTFRVTRFNEISQTQKILK